MGKDKKNEVGTIIHVMLDTYKAPEKGTSSLGEPSRIATEEVDLSEVSSTEDIKSEDIDALWGNILSAGIQIYKLDFSNMFDASQDKAPSSIFPGKTIGPNNKKISFTSVEERGGKTIYYNGKDVVKIVDGDTVIIGNTTFNRDGSRIEAMDEWNKTYYNEYNMKIKETYEAHTNRDSSQTEYFDKDGNSILIAYGDDLKEVYDENGLIKSATYKDKYGTTIYSLEDGKTVITEKDTEDRTTKIIYSKDSYITFYPETGKERAVRKEDGSYKEWDEHGNLISDVGSDGKGVKSSYNYDEDGNIESIYTYRVDGLKEQTLKREKFYPDGNPYFTEIYNDEGNLVYSDRYYENGKLEYFNNRATGISRSYKKDGKLSSETITKPDGTIVGYTSSGTVAGIVNPDNSAIEYDSFGTKIMERTSDGLFTYYQNGVPIFTVDANHNIKANDIAGMTVTLAENKSYFIVEGPNYACAFEWSYIDNPKEYSDIWINGH